jgi:hypothetical protein
MSSKEQEELAEKWILQVNERCKEEYQNLLEASKHLWGIMPINSVPIEFIGKVENGLYDNNPVVLSWKKACDAFSQAIKERTEMPDFFAESRYYSVLEDALR